MAGAAPKKGSSGQKKTENKTWISRLTYPLVFYGAALAVCDSIIGVGMMRAQSDETIIRLAYIMLATLVVTMGFVGVLVYRKPKNLMLGQQLDTDQDLRVARRVREATRMLLESPRPSNFRELLQQLDDVERMLTEESE